MGKDDWFAAESSFGLRELGYLPKSGAIIRIILNICGLMAASGEGSLYFYV